MTETLASAEIQSYSDTAESYQMAELLTSDVVFDQVTASLRSTLEADPELVTLDDIENQLIALGPARDFAGVAPRKALAERQEAVPQDTIKNYRKIKEQLYMLDQLHTRVVDAGSIEGEVIQALINDAPQLQPELPSPAPFAGYKENGATQWALAADISVKEYLAKRQYKHLDRPPKSSQEKNRIRIDASQDGGINFPLDLIADLSGFASLDGDGEYKRIEGEYESEYNASMPSLDAMKHYASLPTEIPPVHNIVVYVQPNGVMFAGNGEGDSHRIGAAILRGQNTIKANNITVVPIDEYIVSPAEGGVKEVSA